MILSERILAVREYSKLGVSQFAHKVGFKTPQAVRELESGRTKSLSFEAANKILSAYPEINENWLKTGEGQMLNAATKVNSGSNSGDNNGSGPSQRGNKNILINNDPKTIEEEERKICDLEKEITYLKERMADKDKTIVDKDARIAELNNTIARLEKMNDYLMQLK